MDRELKNNKVVALLIVVIVVILTVLYVLFAMNKIKSNNNSNDNQSQKDENKNSYVINYKEENYTTKNRENIEITNNKRNVITIENKINPKAASSIENKLNEISNTNWEEIKKMADITNENSNTGLGVNCLIETGEITNNRLTFIVNTVGSFGGLPWDNNEGYNFDATTGNLLKLTDLGTGVFDYIYNRSISQLEKNNIDSSYLANDWKDRVKKELNKEGNWYFTKDGIKIIFLKYSLSDNAVGMVGSDIINISKKDINPYLNDQYKIK